MEIRHTKIAFLKESARAANYPKHVGDFLDYDNIGKPDFKRLKDLGRCGQGTGHDCALKGIVVQADIRAAQYWWLQFQRYHFHDIVSSQSKMHMIHKMDIEKACNRLVDPRVIGILEEYIADFNNCTANDEKRERFQRIVSNVPMGLELTARVSSNYLQLKSIYLQRRHHKTDEWLVYCDWCDDLPRFIELTQKCDCKI